ncbi:unnamed protein product [Adineta steineri]|uniref:Uncharacterized protein n=1 Tax=Adineta steineri TaxID=433720 RepID=A0A814V6J3_9BILA|nr:unnamed protein product [Adineta steineri]CAF3692892.1 unnamed protein product [Adineta steineri]
MDASSPSTSKLLHQSQLKKYFTQANNGHELTTVVEPNTKSSDLNTTDLTNSESDEENITPPWHNETTMTISATPEKIKKRQQRKAKSIKKTLIQVDDEDEDDEETKAYKQRLRNQPRKLYNDDEPKLKQTLIDAGQKMLDAIICKRCGMAYFPHSAEDKAAHAKYHNYTTSAIRLRNLKHQHTLQQFLDGSIYMIGCTSPSAEQKKAEHVRELVDNELGITTPFNCLWSETKAYFYIEDCTDIVLGYCLAHIVHRVHVLDLTDEANIDTQTEMDKMMCGIARIWVHPDHRRARIATKLLDCIRTNFFFGIVIKRPDLAFSAPTDDGRQFFKKYTHSNRLFIY